MMYKHKQRIYKVTTILFAILLVALLMHLNGRKAAEEGSAGQPKA